MTREMDNKFQEKNLFEFDFDLFDFDDEFLLQVNTDSKKNSPQKKEFDNSIKINLKEAEKSDCKGNKTNQVNDKTVKCSDLPSFIEDFSESDFYDFNKTETHSSKEKHGNGRNDEKIKQPSTSSPLVKCLSPVLGSKVCHKSNISSSTPLKPNDDSNEKPKTNQKDLGNSLKTSQFDYLEADLFEDWDVDEIKKSEGERETVTFSQALKLIEEAESANQSTPTKAANESIDMLTGEVVTADVHNLFERSSDMLQPDRKHSDRKDFSDDDIIVIDDVINVKRKPPAAQKLNFDSKTTKCLNSDVEKEKEKGFGSICFSSDDDDLDFFMQDLLGQLKKTSKCGKQTQGVPNLINMSTDSVKELKDFDLNDSNVAVINVKRRKKVNVIESDTAEDSPSPKFRSQRKSKIRNRRIFQDSFARDFCDLEPEVTREVEVSSDEEEIDEEGEYERSFLDEESYHTQNCSADMMAKYLQSVKDFPRSATFKIPAMKPYNREEVFSQAAEENTDYQIGSFCVNDVEEETKTEMSDLEIAEEILEMDKKKRKKRFQKMRKFK